MSGSVVVKDSFKDGFLLLADVVMLYQDRFGQTDQRRSGAPLREIGTFGAIIEAFYSFLGDILQKSDFGLRGERP